MLTATGEIRDMTVPWLFQEIRAAKKSGTAFFEQDKLVKKVFFSSGDVLFASSNMDDDRLGEFLLRQGRINRAQFEASSEVVIKTKKKLGAVLFEMGLLSPKDLVVQVKLQIKQIILSLFSWRDGKYRFEAGNLPADEIIPLQMSTGNLILEGVQTLDWQVIRKGLPPTQMVLRPSSDPSLVFQKADLSADQIAVLALIDGVRNVEEICSVAQIGDFNTLKAIHLLLALKMAEIGAVRSGKEKLFMRAAANAGGTGGPGPNVSTRRMIEEAFAAMNGQDDFQVLGVNNTMSAEELKKVYFMLAKRYHPDRHFEPEMADMKEKLEALFSRIHDAYQRLSNAERARQQGPAAADISGAGQFEEKRAEDYVENYAEKTARAVSYFNSGMKEFKVGNFWGAAESFAWATRLDPVKGQYFYYYGMSLKAIPRRRHEAEESFQKAIEIDPLKPEYHIELGNLYLSSGLKTKAMDVYRAALRENPHSEKIKQAIKAAGGDAPKGSEAEGIFRKMFKDTNQ